VMAERSWTKIIRGQRGGTIPPSNNSKCFS
jgi:hypothetical protein